jgi:hypothetical protein
MRATLVLAMLVAVSAATGAAAAEAPTTTEFITNCDADIAYCRQWINQLKQSDDDFCAFGECYGALGLDAGPLTDEQVSQALEWMRSRPELAADPYDSSIHKAFEALWPGR